MFLYPWGDMHSLNLGWFLLQFKDWVEKIQEYLDNGGGTSENLANVIAPVFNAANYYQTGDYVLYNNELYKANQDVNPGTWDPSAWDRCLIVDEMGSGGAGVDNVARLMIAGQYSPSFGYQKYAICRYNDKLWMANTNLPSGGEAWNASHWDEITVGAGLTGLKRSDDTLSQQIATLNTALTALQQASNGKHYKFVCGTIRNSGNGWAVLNDSGHNPINITSVAVDSVTNSIEIGHNIGATKVLSIIAVCDETFARLYDVGTSVGLDSTHVYIYRKAHSFGGMIIVNNHTPDLQYSDFTLNAFYPDGGIRVNFPEPLTTAEAFRISTSGMNCICEPFSIGFENAILKARNLTTGEVYTQANIPDNTRLIATFNVDEKLVDPSTIVNANGNIWILGLLEVE